MADNWEPEPRPIPADLETPHLEERLSVLRGFTVAEHLDDRSREIMLELAKHVI